jgi:hypothetical protein
MTVASRFVFSQAELTFLAELCGKGNFPGAPPPVLADKAWTPVVRGLLAAGVVRDSDPPEIADDLAAVLDVVFSSQRSLWVRLAYPVGQDGSAAWALWIKGDAVVRQTLVTPETHELVAGDRSALDGLLATVLDIQIARDSEDGEPQTVAYRDSSAAAQLNVDEGPRAVAERYPAAAAFAQALTDARRSIAIDEHVGPGYEDRSRENLVLVESPHGLWLSRYIKPVGHAEDGSSIVVLQRVSIATARERMAALIFAAA